MNEQGPSLVKFKSPEIKDPKSLAGTQNGTGLGNPRISGAYTSIKVCFVLFKGAMS